MVLKFTVKIAIIKPMQIRSCKTCSSKSAVLKFTVKSAIYKPMQFCGC